jgi:uncharacterized membrane protein (DUF373 family)
MVGACLSCCSSVDRGNRSPNRKFCFHGLLQRGFGGVLIVLLGLELMETLKTYFSEHHIRVEVILVVAIIAVGRHIIKLDFEHVSASLLFGLSVLMIGLTTGYFLVRRSHASKE